MTYGSKPSFVRNANIVARELEWLVSELRRGSNPFFENRQAIDLVVSLNGFGMNWLGAKCGRAEDVRDMIQDYLQDAIRSRPDGCSLIETLGCVLRSEFHHTSWLNTEKQRWRHRLIDALAHVFRENAETPLGAVAFQQLCETVISPNPMVTLDVRGQSIDFIQECIGDIPKARLKEHLHLVTEAVQSLVPCDERPLSLLITDWHDTVDPHIRLPAQSVLDVLWCAAEQKAQEHAFVYGLRLLNVIVSASHDVDGECESAIVGSDDSRRRVASVKRGVLTAPEFTAFISERLPSRATQLSDYVVNRNQSFVSGLTLQELCRILTASLENASSDWRSRKIITAFYRQVFGMGQTANVGLEARPFFIDHGFGRDGGKLDWPSYVFVPAGAIWGKGAGVDLSCGVAFGGGVNLTERRGRDGAYIGGSWSATLYHGHSHIGGERESEGAESRDRILHFGLTVDDSARLPWGQYVEAEHHLAGDIYRGVRTYRLTPS